MGSLCRTIKRQIGQASVSYRDQNNTKNEIKYQKRVSTEGGHAEKGKARVKEDQKGLQRDRGRQRW